MDVFRLVASLTNPPEAPYPVILPDFFLDHFVKVDSFKDLLDGLELLAEQGGGNLLGTEQLVRRGGNSVNTASALKRLGLDPVVIVTTDEYGASLMRALVDEDLDLSHVHEDGRLSATVSIEAEHEGRRINLMISDSGSASRFEFSDFTEEDLTAIRGCGLVALLNLNHNEAGSQLASELFEFVKSESRAQTFMDIGDPSSHPEYVKPIVDHVLREGLVDFLGVNENEVIWLTRALGDTRWSEKASNPDAWLDAALHVSSELEVRIDLHTPYYSSTILDDDVVSAPAFEAHGAITLGAGDAWNAGSIWGYLHRLEPEDRIVLANAVAALYVSSPDVNHPTRTEIVRFLESVPPLSGHGKKLLKLG